MDAGGGGGGGKRKRRRKNQRAINGMPNDQQADATANGAAGDGGGEGAGKWKSSVTAKARSLMNLHNNEAGRRVSTFLVYVLLHVFYKSAHLSHASNCCK